jgi:hypothetical protein
MCLEIATGVKPTARAAISRELGEANPRRSAIHEQGGLSRMRTTLTALAGALALAFPAGALAHRAPAGSHGADHPNAARSHGKAHNHGQASNHRHIPMVALIARGTVVSVDSTSNTAVVQVTRANHHGASLVGTQVTIDLSKAKISVADVNADGQENLADVAVNDRVLVQGRIPLRGSLTGALVARRLIDQTHPASSDSSGSTQTTSAS